MDAYKLHVKFYAENVDGSDVEPFIPVFHRWIRDHVLDELMIDVADYSHVHHGPGVVLVGHASDYYLDVGEGRPGLLYSRKRQPPEPAERLRDAFRRALNACRLLSEEPLLEGKPRFKTDEVLVRIADRLLGSGSDGFEQLKAETERLAKDLYAGIETNIVKTGGPRDLVSVRLHAPGAPDVGTLLGRLGGPISGSRVS